ncbi:MAG: hypothetical protein IPH45_08940 [Bacteroidales bacterium]|nr:hypothetical protein [Bacteroidales bacterium]
MRDYENPFRQMTYQNTEEMYAVMGNPAKNSFIKMQKQQFEKTQLKVSALLKNWGLE